VDAGSGVDGNCNTAAAPCLSIQAAVDRAASGDTILVAGSDAFAYTFGGVGACTRGYAVTAVVCIGAGKQLILRGGYAPGDYGVADPRQHPTIIDGEDRAYGVFINGFTRTAETGLDMSGFVIRRGLGVGIANRSGPDAYFGYGGGMRVENVGSITLQDVVFESNRAVGGDRAQGAGGAGAGGALAFRAANAVLDRVRFTGNQALGGAGATRGGYAQGGALFTYDTTLQGTNLLFENNVARAGSSAGGGSDNGRADGQGGGAVFMQRSQITLENITLRSNQAIGGDAGREAGGAFGGGFFAEEAVVTVAGAQIRNNLVQVGSAPNTWIARGGGFSSIHSTLTVDRAYVVANVAQGGAPNGGGIGVTRDPGGPPSNFTLTNSIVAGNKALTGNQAGNGGGGGVWLQGVEATLLHTTIADNELGPGPGLFGQGIILPGASPNVPGATLLLRSSLITGHSGAVGSALEVFAGNQVSVEGGLFFGNTRNAEGAIAGLDSMETADPLYVSPGAISFDYRIAADSPARDRVNGSPLPVDFEGEQRNDGAADYGADEYVQTGNDNPGLPPGEHHLFLPALGG
jgi:hypothetical protein